MCVTTTTVILLYHFTRDIIVYIIYRPASGDLKRAVMQLIERVAQRPARHGLLCHCCVAAGPRPTDQDTANRVHIIYWRLFNTWTTYTVRK
jgi:hypothetical protein